MNRIKELRIRHGMSHQELAYLTGLSHDIICKLEKGEQNITVTSVERLAAVLKTDPAYLVGWRSDPLRMSLSQFAEENVSKAIDYELDVAMDTKRMLRKEYAGGVVIVLKDDTRLYDHADISDVEWNVDNERNLVMCGKDYIVPTGNVKYVQRIPDSTEEK